MIITIVWDHTDEKVELVIGTIMCEIPHKGHLPITVSTKENLESKMVTTISNEGDRL